MCNHVFKPLYYTCTDYYKNDHDTCTVELQNRYNSKKGTLVYCLKCGQVFIEEIAEKPLEEE